MTRQRMPLGDVLEELIDHRGKTPKKLGGDWVDSGHRVVSAINIKGSRVDSNEHHYISPEMYARWMKVPLKAGDVLLTSEAPTGEVAYVAEDCSWAVGQRLFGLRGRKGLLDGRYLFYALRGGEARHQLMSRTTGTTVSGIRQAELVKIELDLPPIAEQRAVAATLGALDDKIESNRRAVTLLQKLVRAEFERVIGDGAESVPLGAVASITKGRSYKSAELQASDTALVTLKSIDRNGGYKDDGLKPYTGDFKQQQIVEPGELVVAQTDLTQGAEVVGRGVRVPEAAQFKTLVASLDLAIVRPLEDMPTEYLYGLLTSESFRQHCRNHVTGTTVLHLAKDAIPTWRAPVVAHAAQSAFARFARSMLNRMDALNEESEILVGLRDVLLPELLSGRIRVPEAQEAVA